MSQRPRMTRQGSDSHETLSRGLWSALIWILGGTSLLGATPSRLVLCNDPAIAYIGRFELGDPGKAQFMYSGCTLRTRFTGTSIAAVLRDSEHKNYFNVTIDGHTTVLETNRPDDEYVLATNLGEGLHALEITRRTEWHGGNTSFEGFRIDSGARLSAPEVSDRWIEFIGDSYTCGYGVEGKSRDEHFAYATENSTLSFGFLTARALHAEARFVCRSGIGIVQAYGGDRAFTMPLLYEEVIQHDMRPWDYSRNPPQVVVIDLSDNDYHMPLDRAEFISTYVKFLARIRGHYPHARIVCLAGPSPDDDTWKKWSSDVKTAVESFRAHDSGVTFHALANQELHGSDWHPNAAEHRKAAAELEGYLRGLTGWN